jgi:hypothetical protein
MEGDQKNLLLTLIFFFTIAGYTHSLLPHREPDQSFVLEALITSHPHSCPSIFYTETT